MESNYAFSGVGASFASPASLPPSVQFGQAAAPSQLLQAGAQQLGLQHLGAQQLGAGAQQLGAGLQQPVWRTRTTLQQRVGRTGRQPQPRAASAEPTATNNMAATATALKTRLIIVILLQHPRGEGT